MCICLELVVIGEDRLDQLDVSLMAQSGASVFPAIHPLSFLIHWPLSNNLLVQSKVES